MILLGLFGKVWKIQKTIYNTDGNPLLFETMMTLDDEFLDKQWRYATWDEALASHHRIAEQLRCI